jgi:zinc transporter, ZIP family
MSTEDSLGTTPLIQGETSDSTMNHIGSAIGLVVLSGGATAMGAAVVYFPSLVNLAESRTLAVSLGLSAGVMVFVSFVEIFVKSQAAFEDAGFAPDKAYAMAIVTFFAGSFLMLVSLYL